MPAPGRFFFRLAALETISRACGRRIPCKPETGFFIRRNSRFYQARRRAVALRGCTLRTPQRGPRARHAVVQVFCRGWFDGRTGGPAPQVERRIPGKLNKVLQRAYKKPSARTNPLRELESLAHFLNSDDPFDSTLRSQLLSELKPLIAWKKTSEQTSRTQQARWLGASAIFGLDGNRFSWVKNRPSRFSFLETGMA